MVKNPILRRIWEIVASYVISSATAIAAWTAGVEQNGLLKISVGGANAVSSTFAIWGKNWALPNQSVDVKVVAPFEYAFTIKNRNPNFDLTGHVRKSSDRQLLWEFGVNFPNTTSSVIGTGISFKFDLTTFGREMGEPELIPGNGGWIWGKDSIRRVEMRFTRPLAALFFEKGRRNEIRAIFSTDEIPQGLRRYVTTLSVSGDMVIGPMTSERYGRDSSQSWPANILDWQVSPVDLSFLNAPDKPSGKRGFLIANKDRLIFEDGTIPRFWGTNLAAYSLFGTSKENVKLQARRISELGFNLVRLHHHDSDYVNPNVFGNTNIANTQYLDSNSLEKLDWWIKCLSDEGIYIWLDLHVGRRLKVGDGIEGFSELVKDKLNVDLRGYNYVNASIQRAMKRFNEAYVNHTNGYTGLRYKDSPSIIGMLITNENDITNHFGNQLLPDRNVPKHNALYMAQADAFASKYKLQKDKVWRSWEYGPSKLFLNNLEYRFGAEMMRHLRSLGSNVPIATTNSWGDNPLSSLPALTAGAIVDAHVYGGSGELEKNPLYGPNLMHWLAAAHVAGFPFSVTEWNVSPFPAPDRHSIPLYLAASASYQGWNAMMQYAYAKDPINQQGKPSNWQAYNDPGLISTLPAAALLYRQGHIQEAKTVYAFAPSKEQLFNRLISPANSIALRTAAEKGKLLISLPEVRELPWLVKIPIPAGAQIITNPDHQLLPNGATESISDTGELRRNWENGVYTISTPRTQAAIGWIGGKKISLADVDITVKTSNATVAVQSMNADEISNSRAILISLGARSIPKSENSLPFYSEPVEGQLLIRAPKGLKLYRENRAAKESREIPVPYMNGRYHINLERRLEAYWLVLKQRPIQSLSKKP